MTISPKKTFFSIALPLTALPVAAQESNNVEGVWFSGFRNNNRGEIQFELTIIDSVGALAVEGRRWQGYGNGNCNYVFEIDGNTTTSMHLNTASSYNDECPTEFPFSASRRDQDTILMQLDPSLGSALGGLNEFEMTGGLRPLLDSNRRAEIEGLDILGIETGMTRSEVESVLLDRGFEIVGSPLIRSGDGFTLSSEHWSRNPDNEGQDTDHISLSYSAVIEGVNSPEQLVAISRVDAPLSPFSVAAFKNALLEKYGPPASVTDDREFLRDGRNANRSQNLECQDGPHQALRFTHSTYTRFGPIEYNGQFNIYCAAQVDVMVAGDTATGSVRDYSIKIYDIDMIWEDFWRRWSTQRQLEISQTIEAVRNLSTDAPDL